MDANFTSRCARWNIPWAVYLIPVLKGRGKLSSPGPWLGVGISDWEQDQPAQADLFEQPEQQQDNQQLLQLCLSRKTGK